MSLRSYIPTTGGTSLEISLGVNISKNLTEFGLDGSRTH